jgi:hypothetical protein
MRTRILRLLGRSPLDVGWARSTRVAIALTAVLAAVALRACFGPLRAEANEGPPYYANGSFAAEPSGLAGIGISRESLDIDMRRLSARPSSPLGKRGSPEFSNAIEVSVTYAIANRGPEREVALIFASGAPDTTGFTAALDGRAIAAQLAADAQVPAEWQPPITTPGLNGKDLIYLGPAESTYVVEQVEPWAHYPGTTGRTATSTYAFTVTIPSGASALTVRYRAEPQQYRSGGYSDYLNSYQFAYVLAPARACDGFGKLDVTVRLPACWAAASRPQLTRSGDVLSGSFGGVPADALALTVAPCESAKPKGFCGLGAVVLPLGALGMVLVRRRRMVGAA